MRTRLAFLYLYHTYHALHSGPIAFELSRIDSNLDVTLFSSHRAATDLLYRLSGIFPESRLTIHELAQPLSFRYFNWKHRTFPKPREILENHARLFEDMDFIVDTTFAGLRLANFHGINKPKYIMSFHGSGDRAYGFQERLKEFDFLLLSGPKIYNRLSDLQILRENNWAMVGYPKFDIVDRLSSGHFPIFPEKRPIVLYNPHFQPALSSWYVWGHDILDFFVRSTEYNLIFAPHVELKGRTQRWLKLRKYQSYPHIHIDLGSGASIDMTYTTMADIYLGDVSSQIIEFLRNPRPCIFLNGHGVKWDGDPNYLHWTLGPVLDSPNKLEAALQTDTHSQYIDAQKKYFDDSIELTEVPSVHRAAKSIQDFIYRE